MERSHPLYGRQGFPGGPRTGISKQLSRNEYGTLLEQAPIMIWRANTDAECNYFTDPGSSFENRLCWNCFEHLPSVVHARRGCNAYR